MGRISRSGIAATLTLVLAAGAASPTHAAGEDDLRIAQGFAIAPVRLNLRGLDRAKVGLGSYLVNAMGGCNDCHTNPPFAPGNPFEGDPVRVNAARYLAGGTSFGPGIVSRNITPDAKRRPGGLTFRQFAAALRRGQDADDPGRLLQVMPWPIFRNMNGRDLQAIYEYLRAIPSIPQR